MCRKTPELSRYRVQPGGLIDIEGHTEAMRRPPTRSGCSLGKCCLCKLLTAPRQTGRMISAVHIAALIFAAGLACAGSAQAAPKYDAAAVARIQAAIVDCPGCNLQGADLTNTCVKEHNLTGANFDGANASLMCMSFANFTNASFRGTDLSAANMAGAKMDGADMTGALTSITSFLGTDLRKAKGLTQKQIDVACSDDKTKLPAGLTPHFCK